MDKKYSAHHKVPRSRGGKETVLIPDQFHKAWHTIFGNLYDDEAIRFIKGVNALFETEGKVTSAELKSLRDECRRR